MKMVVSPREPNSYPPTPIRPIRLPDSPGSHSGSGSATTDTPKLHTSFSSPSRSHSHSSFPSSNTKTIPSPIPIPWAQFLPLLCVRIANALTYIVVFPFITEYITSLDVEPSRIGLYAGMAEGSLMLVESATATIWARLADRYGRKKCLVWGFGLFVGSGAMVGFGRSVGWIIFWRGVFGLNACGVVERLFLGQISHPTNRTRMISIYSPGFSIGIVLGSMIGGEMASPYGRLPTWLGGGSDLFRDYPYALPGLVTTIAGIASVIYAQVVIFDETDPNAKARLFPSHDEADAEAAAEAGEDNAPSPAPSKSMGGETSLKALSKVPHFKTFILVFFAFQIATFAFWGVFSVYTYTPVAHGGLGLPIENIGWILSVDSMVFAVSTPFVVPYLQRKLGTRGALLLALSLYPVGALLLPLAQWTAVRALENEKRWIWSILAVQLALKTGAGYAWPLCDGVLFAVLDGYRHLLATACAIQLMSGAAGRAFGPTIAGWIYTLSGQYPVGTLARQASWLGLLALTIPAVLLTTQLPGHLGKENENTGSKEEREGYVGLPTLEEGEKEEPGL